MKTLTLTAAQSIGELTVAVLLLTFGFGCAGDRGENPAPLELEDGKNVFEAADRSWTGISRVWYYRPSSEKALRVLMVIHGAGRNAEDYLDSWIEIAEDWGFLVVAPEFSEKRAIRIGSAWEWRFNTGNVVSSFRQDVAEENWYFQSVERLFDSIRHSDERVMDRYVIFGHSAGGQFVHRMVLFQPEVHFDLAIAANSGWYTLPDEDMDFPYGLSGAPHSKERLRLALGRPLVVFLGTEDSPDQGGFRKSSEAMLQGAGRMQRGTFFYNEAQRFASEQDISLGWALEHAQGVGHDYRGMALASVRLLQERRLISTSQP
jgi:pimeloyl-ACP methyl ester carboxylesterase